MSGFTSPPGASVSLPVTVAQGGTGGTTAASARSGIGAAAAGANSDITSLAGLTTALSVLQGGTGGTTAAGARSGIGAAAAGANSDITSLAGLSTALSVAQGGTGATSAAAARTSLAAAASGANTDITSLAGLTTPLSIAQGGTGANSAGNALANLGAVASSTLGTRQSATRTGSQTLTANTVTDNVTLVLATAGTYLIFGTFVVQSPNNVAQNVSMFLDSAAVVVASAEARTENAGIGVPSYITATLLALVTVAANTTIRSRVASSAASVLIPTIVDNPNGSTNLANTLAAQRLA